MLKKIDINNFAFVYLTWKSVANVPQKLKKLFFTNIHQLFSAVIGQVLVTKNGIYFSC